MKIQTEQLVILAIIVGAFLLFSSDSEKPTTVSSPPPFIPPQRPPLRVIWPKDYEPATVEATPPPTIEAVLAEAEMPVSNAPPVRVLTEEEQVRQTFNQEMQDRAEFAAELDEAERRHATIANRQRLGYHPAMPMQQGVSWWAHGSQDVPDLAND